MPCSHLLSPCLVRSTSTNPKESAAPVALSFLLGGIRTARTKQIPVQGSKARLEASMKDWHFSWKESQEIFAIPNVYRKLRGTREISKASICFPLWVQGKPITKKSPNAIPVWDVHWGMGNFKGNSSAGRRRVDRLTDPIFARAALCAAQMEQTEADWTRKMTTICECSKCAKKASLP